MATAADPNNTQASTNALESTARVLCAALAWGALMLFVFGFWMRSKYENRAPIVTYIFLISGVAAAGMALWQAFTLWLQKLPPEQKKSTLEQQSRLFSYVFLAGGIGLIILAFALGFDKKGAAGNYAFKPDNFAETFGALLLGIISLCGGYVLQQPASGQVSPIQFLVDKIHALKLFQIIVGAACICGFGYLFYTHRTNFTTWWPELAGLLFMSMLCLSCVLWLNTGKFDEFGIRLFVLVFGGTTGVIVFFMTLCRAYLWRQDILLGGAAAWQGENAWHFWLCAYVLFASLVLMFVSFNLARADIRKNVALRRVMYGYDAVVQGLLLIGIMTILNIVIYALIPFTFDWTKNRGAYALADSSKNLIAGLPQETNILVLLPQTSDMYKDVRNLMDNCQALASRERLKIQYISPDINQIEFANLVGLFPEILPDLNPGSGRGVLIVYGAMPTKKNHTVPHSFVPERRLFEAGRPMARGDKPKFEFKGEVESLKEVKFLVDGRKKRKIYILQGNDEPDINNDDFDGRRDFSKGFGKVGIGHLVDRLKADNYDVAGLSFNLERPGDKNPHVVFVKDPGKGKRKEIPDDCHTLIVVSPTRTFNEELKLAIGHYMDHQNGKMLVFLDVVADADYTKMQSSGLEPILKTYGVDVTNEYILKLPDRFAQEALILIASTPPRSENTLAKRFSDRGLLMKLSARVVKPADAGRYKAETILQVESPPGKFHFVEKDVKTLDFENLLPYLNDVGQNPLKRVTTSAKEPISVAVAVSEADGKKPRLVVFGDTEFITNIDLARSAQQRTINYSLAVNALEWMATPEDLPGVLPSTIEKFELSPTVDFWRMVLLPGWLMLLVLIGLGVGFWLVRRR